MTGAPVLPSAGSPSVVAPGGGGGGSFWFANAVGYSGGSGGGNAHNGQSVVTQCSGCYTGMCNNACTASYTGVFSGPLQGSGANNPFSPNFYGSGGGAGYDGGSNNFFFGGGGGGPSGGGKTAGD